jgi:DNA-binding MarR family transcriptional regulator
MMTRIEPLQCGGELLRFVENWAEILSDLRGFELPVIRILLHLDQTKSGELCCTQGEAARFFGIPESISLRLCKIMDSQGLIELKEGSSCSIRILLKDRGQDVIKKLKCTNELNISR